jgi:Uma2 family endonuclease
MRREPSVYIIARKMSVVTTSPISTIKMTAEQFLQLGEDPPGVRLELVNGEIAVTPSPTPSHSSIDTILRIILGNHIRAHDLGKLYGDVDTILDDFNVRRPDILYFAKSRLHLVGEKAMEGPPDLCIEILSPSSERIDRKVKFEQYRKAGVAHYWIVDPKSKAIEAYKLTRGKYRLAGSGAKNDAVRLAPFEALEIPLAELWH